MFDSDSTRSDRNALTRYAICSGQGALGGFAPRVTEQAWIGRIGRAPTALDKPVSLDKLMGVYDPVFVQLLLPGVAN